MILRQEPEKIENKKIIFNVFGHHIRGKL